MPIVVHKRITMSFFFFAFLHKIDRDDHALRGWVENRIRDEKKYVFMSHD